MKYQRDLAAKKSKSTLEYAIKRTATRLGDPFPLHGPDETHLEHPVLDSPVQERHGLTGASPLTYHKDK